MALNIYAKFERKIVCTLKNDMRIWQIFTGLKIAILFWKVKWLY